MCKLPSISHVPCCSSPVFLFVFANLARIIVFDPCAPSFSNVSDVNFSVGIRLTTSYPSHCLPSCRPLCPLPSAVSLALLCFNLASDSTLSAVWVPQTSSLQPLPTSVNTRLTLFSWLLCFPSEGITDGFETTQRWVVGACEVLSCFSRQPSWAVNKFRWEAVVSRSCSQPSDVYCRRVRARQSLIKNPNGLSQGPVF